MLKPLKSIDENLEITGYITGDSMQIKKLPKLTDITVGKCGNDKHGVMVGASTGAHGIGDTIYHWDSCCDMCIREKLKEIENEAP